MTTLWHHFNKNHEELKRKIHSFRIPLSPNGQRIMKVVYFSIPVIGGYFIMQSTNAESTKALESRHNPKATSPLGLQYQNEALQQLLRSVVNNETQKG